MKAVMKFAGIALVFTLDTGLTAWAQTKTYVDAYSSASETKATLTGDAFEAVAKALQAGSCVLL